MIEIIKHALGLCSDSSLHLNVLGMLITPEFDINAIKNFITNIKHKK